VAVCNIHALIVAYIVMELIATCFWDGGTDVAMTGYYYVRLLLAQGMWWCCWFMVCREVCGRDWQYWCYKIRNRTSRRWENEAAGFCVCDLERRKWCLLQLLHLSSNFSSSQWDRDLAFHAQLVSLRLILFLPKILRRRSLRMSPVPFIAGATSYLAEVIATHKYVS